MPSSKKITGTCASISEGPGSQATAGQGAVPTGLGTDDTFGPHALNEALPDQIQEIFQKQVITNLEPPVFASEPVKPTLE